MGERLDRTQEVSGSNPLSSIGIARPCRGLAIPIVLCESGRCPLLGAIQAEAWWRARYPSRPGDELSGERSDLDSDSQEVSGSNPLSSIAVASL